MCGISGIVTYQTDVKLIKSIINVSDEIKHRGPDDEGFVFLSEGKFTPAFGKDTPQKIKESTLPFSPKINVTDFEGNSNVVLSHRRLSIIDLSENAHQPMCNNSKDYWIVFNGEIYNYKNIRLELVNKGYKFISNSDTEVVLNAYIEWGKECLHKFNGMWSFVIYDKNKKKLFGARDRFGVKPMYFINNEKYFAFCSEIKGLLKIDNFKKEINEIAVYDYLVLNKLEVEEESFFKNIFELKAAHYFELNLTDKALTKKKYYHLKINKKWESYDKSNLDLIIKNISKKIKSAINLRLNADVKVGACLSGGLDSSIVVTQVDEILSEKKTKKEDQQQVFTATYPNTSIDESKWAKIVVDQTKTKWDTTSPNAFELKKELEKLVYLQDIPFTSSSTFSQYKVIELAHKNGVKVTLDGQGADELFGGYAPHYASSIFNSFITFNLKDLASNFKVKKGSFSNHQLLHKLPLKHLMYKYAPNLFFNQLLKIQPELNFINTKLHNTYKKRWFLLDDKFNPNINDALKNNFTVYGLNYLMRTADRNSMHFSIESRMPFADDIDLIEYVFSISGKYKIKDGKSKFLLREATKNLIPDKIYNRTDKIGFSTPEKDWFSALKPYFKELINRQQGNEFINWKDLNENFDSVFDNALNTDISRLWRIIIFALWREVYEV